MNLKQLKRLFVFKFSLQMFEFIISSDQVKVIESILQQLFKILCQVDIRRFHEGNQDNKSQTYKQVFEFKQLAPVYSWKFHAISMIHTPQTQQKDEYMMQVTNIEKAKKMSICEIQKKENRSQSIQNILSSSIAKAKQKIQMMEQKKHTKDYRDSITNRSLQKKQNQDVNLGGKIGSQANNQEVQTARSKKVQEIETTRSKDPVNKSEANSAVVGVVKSLQLKIAQLEKINESNELERKLMNKELNNVSQEKKLLLETIEQVKKKNFHLQQTLLKSSKQQIKELQQNVQKLQGQNMNLKNQIKELQLKLKQQHQNHLSIQKNNEKKLKEKKQEEKNIQKAQMLYVSKLKETELFERNLHIKEKEMNEREKKLELKWKEINEKQQQIMAREKVIQEKEKKNYDEIVRHNQTMSLANQVRKELQDKHSELKKTLQQDKKKIKQLHLALQQEKTSKQQLELSIAQTYTNKISELQDEIQQMKQTFRGNTKSKLSVANKNDKIDLLKDQLAQLIEQYDDLLTKFKKSEDKLDKEQKQSKNYRSKFWKLKEIIAQISQKVSKMPNAIHSQLKLLIVKANKLQSFDIEKASLSNIYGTPNKKLRSSSIENKSTSKLSKQRSKSKEKSLSKHNTINLTYLDSSRKSNTSAKSKRSQKSQRSLSKKKQVILSTTNKALTNETDMKIQALERQIQDLKTNYKKLVEIMNERNDEDTRNQLNSLVFELQQKSQELTKLKKQKKAKKL